MNQILSTLTGASVDDPRSVIEQGFLGNSTVTANCLIKTFNVNSISRGTIISADIEPMHNTWCITVEVNSRTWIRYCGLGDFEVTAGQQIKEGTYIGPAYKHSMRLEYCTPEKSNFPVRISNRQFYKHDPTPIIFGQINLSEVI